MPNTTQVQLADPIEIDGTEVTEITLREPKGGDLRGLLLAQLMNMDPGEVAKLVPRISTPAVTEDQFDEMGFGDISAISTSLVGFMARSPTMAAMARAMGSTG